ncbi:MULTISPECIES: DUF2267 domain-containing protein [Streptomyces]|uniref:DUF2267 domain-containing protein n=1 Tax=Streptomyces lycii TaxID=2654337 RepID=A0ABQ7FG66_9ACTN|nr:MULTISPECIES: DUF2267 domain-containing protein [Streptomyces]KAF4406237.1 DUF2267 domain-containing protein [Streptomyces lycii]PGH52222.1 hypothetical protein CRI70_02475 [Streptomyces sp. Ru87]
MPYGAFLTVVRERGGYTPDEAERITEAVLTALGTRLTADVAGHLADQLPEPMADMLNDAVATPQDWGVREFLTRIAETTGDDLESAEAHTRTVLSTLAEQISGGERNKVLSRLPSGYADLFGFPELAG